MGATGWQLDRPGDIAEVNEPEPRDFLNQLPPPEGAV